MVSLIRTEDVPPDQRQEAWRRTVCDTLGPLDMRSDPDAPLTGEIKAGQPGAVRVGKVRTETPHSVHRTPGLIRRDSPENYRVVLAMAGTHRLVQDGRVALVHPASSLSTTSAARMTWTTGRPCSSPSSPSRGCCCPSPSMGSRRSPPSRWPPTTGPAPSCPPLLRRVALDLDSFPRPARPGCRRCCSTSSPPPLPNGPASTPRKRRSRCGGACCWITRSSSSTWLTGAVTAGDRGRAPHLLPVTAPAVRAGQHDGGH